MIMNLEKKFHKLKIGVEKKEKQLKIEETKTALLKADLEVKIKQYESLKVQKAILIEKRRVKKQAHEMETFLQNMPTNTDKRDCLKSEDIKLSLKLSKIQEIKGGSGLVGKQAVAYSGAMNDVKPVQNSSEQDIILKKLLTCRIYLEGPYIRKIPEKAMTQFSFLPHEPIFCVILRPPTGESS